ncbi:U3 small nucleolar RNA-associated protein [Coemansia sp. Benny D115]|nr:U3 small nucleolar RNA-associated protein [Coemansia sp. Benny D115]
MDYRPIGAAQAPQATKHVLPEAAYWKKFQSPILVKEYGMVTSLAFNPAHPHDLLVSASTRLQIYNGRTGQLKKSITRFNSLAHSGSFRSDGKLLVAGDDSGLVQVFDGNTRSILRMFKGHQDPVHFVRFMPSRTEVVSGSDDTTVRLWDISSQTAVMTFEDHTDYVRSGCVLNENPHLFATGSYDHTVRLWDTRANKCMMSIDIDDPVESVAPLPGASVLAVAGGPSVQMFDILMGGRPMATMGNHEKTVTSLCVDTNGGRLIAGSLDHHVKVYDMQSFKMTYSATYPAPVLSVALSPDNTMLAVGMASGVFSLRRRVESAKEKASTQAVHKQPSYGSRAYFNRGSNNLGANDDLRIEHRRYRTQASYDKYMRKFEYAKALDDALTRKRMVSTACALIQELLHQDALVRALAGRDELTLDPILTFIVRNIEQPRYTSLLTKVAEIILDMYGDLLFQSPRVLKMLRHIHDKVNTELNTHKEINSLMGMMDLLMSASQVNQARASYQLEEDSDAAKAL